MGLSKGAFRFMALEHGRRPFSGRVLTLGRQCVYATFPELQRILRDEGIRPPELPPEFDRGSNIPSWRSGRFAGNTSDVAFFRLLGLQDVQALDVDDFEGADIVWDLNRPITSEMAAQWDLIVDSGTLEHVFDVRTALRNIVGMLRRGGRIVHITPANNYCNHGFYQFSPTFFTDYYGANQFRDVRVFVAEESLRREETHHLDLFEFETARQPCRMASPTSRRLLVFCIAEKGDESTADRVPTQSYYSAVFAAARQSEESRRAAEQQHIPSQPAARIMKRWLPFPLYAALRAAWQRARGWFLTPAEVDKPWGMRFWRRLE